ncbi:alpha/beta fold hydrolase [Actinophytocola sp.]|uniref:alpha/beta fold hydrolase n=1 Tax=Actinophytocola sp. TaxID=1872138 RepID=UPI002D74E2C7|nr:alpha/beta fold hydrolase [Actinophytocola sp.]HYQ63995.1 alpha/beta fold hydrolase [Actinophytocola sp.]
MSRAEDLRAARESRAGAAERVNRRGPGDAVTRMVDAAVHRATRHPVQNLRPGWRRCSTVDTGPAPLGPDFRAAMRTANARIDALDLAELRTPAGTVRYLDVGDGPPVLLVHGIFGGPDAAMRQLRSLVPGGFRLIVPSRFGYLGSSLPARATPARQADVFADLLDGLGIEKAAVVAVSAGATSALQFALRHRDRVSSLALLSPNGPGWQHERRRMPYRIARALWGSDRLMWTVRRHFRDRLARLVAVPGGQPLRAVDHARLDAELDGVFPLSRRVNGALFDAFVSNPDINACDLADISTPTLIVHARDDALAPCWGGIALSERIPGARLLVVEHGGHLMLGEHPEVAAAVEALLRSTQD